MNRWPDIRAEYAAWLRTFPMLGDIGRPGDALEVIDSSEEPPYVNVAFWSQRTHEAEARAWRHLTDPEIDEVAAIIDEDLLRFDPLVAYCSQFAPDGDPERLEAEREIAHSVKRDLAWAAIEQAIGEPGFFCTLLPWYDRGRWPCGWAGAYPVGHVRVL